MRAAFVTNYFNHHQKFLADALYNLLGDGNYYLIETTDIPEFRQKLGYQKCSAPYLLRYGENTQEKTEKIIATFDAVIYTSGPRIPIKPIRNRYRDGKLTFCYSERRYKSISRYLKYPIYTLISHYVNKGYLLCASAFAARDYHLSGMSLGKCFRWGYFPEVKMYDDINTIISSKKSNAATSKTISILWVARLIGLKHPEALVSLAEKLKRDNYDFEVNIIGNGELEQNIKKSITSNNLENHIHLLGSMKPDEVRKHMEKADIFLFTSDRNEGWGAVLNESMNSACAVVASDAIGATPYLLKDGENGLIYKSGCNEELYQKVKYLIDNPEQRRKLQERAYKTLAEVWNPQNAAQRFIKLIGILQQGKTTPYTDGPCSPAPFIRQRGIL